MLCLHEWEPLVQPKQQNNEVNMKQWNRLVQYDPIDSLLHVWQQGTAADSNGYHVAIFGAETQAAGRSDKEENQTVGLADSVC